MKTSIIHTLYSTNNILIHRVRKKQFFYFIFIALLSLFFIICFGIPLLFLNNNRDDLRVGLGLITYAVLVADILITSIRFQNQALVEPKHIIHFPICNEKKLDYQLLLLLSDLKSFLYISTLLIVFIYFIKQAAFIEAIISIFVWLLFLLTICMWTLILITLANKIIGNRRDNIIVIYFILLYSLMSINIFHKYDLFYYMPISGYSSNCLFGLASGDHLLLISNLILLVLLFFFGKLCFKSMYH